MLAAGERQTDPCHQQHGQYEVMIRNGYSGAAACRVVSSDAAGALVFSGYDACT